MIVNENYIKEYEEMSLCDFADELVEPLCIIKKDLTKAIYIRYAEERDKNDELEKENSRLKENNMSMQKEMARTWEKADLYKEVIEEVKDRITIKLGRYINEKDYVIDDVALDELLQILDKVKD